MNDQGQRELQLLETDVLVKHLPRLSVADDVARRLLLGQCVQTDTAGLSIDSLARLYRDDVFLGLVTILMAGEITPRRLVATA